MAGAGFRSVVQRAEGVDEALEHRAIPLGIAGVESDGVRAVLCPEGQQLLRNLPVRFLPGDGLPLAAATLSNAAQGRLNPVRARDVFLVGIAQRAELSAGLRIAWRDLPDLLVCDLHVDGAAPGADTADAFSDFDSHCVSFFRISRSSGSGVFGPAPPECRSASSRSRR